MTGDHAARAVEFAKVVLFATALFFAGSSTKLEAPGLRRALLAFGVRVFFGTTVWLATVRVSLAV